MRTSNERRKQLARIHLLAKQVGLNDVAYRNMLWTIARVRSAAQLDEFGRQKVIQQLTSRAATRVNKTMLSPANKKIYALWQQLADIGAIKSRSSASLRSYIKRQTGSERLEWLDNKQAAQLIESMKNWLARYEEENAK